METRKVGSVRKVGRARGWALVILAVAGLVFALGPRARFEGGWVEPRLGEDVDAYLAAEESPVRDLRPGAAKAVVWLDPAQREPTPLSVVYLHGFSADRHEVEPLVSDLAEALGANVYFARLRGHGRDAAAMGEATAEDWLDDAAEAIALGSRIGERVVLMGTSTGGTLATWAAARPETEGRVHALVLVSPNFGVQDPAAPVLLWPWGGHIARLVVGPERCFESKDERQERHWTTCYPTRALLPMMALVARVRSLEAGALHVPTLVVYSRGDRVVDPGMTERVVERLSGGRATLHVLEGSGDPEEHVIAGEIMSPETTDAVQRRIADFLAEVGRAR